MTVRFTQIRGGPPSSASGYAAHLRRLTVEAERQRLIDGVADQEDVPAFVVRHDADEGIRHKLGLSSHHIDEAQLSALLAGRDTSGQRVKAGRGIYNGENHKIIGSYDFTVAAPRSVSLAWAFADGKAEQVLVHSAHLDAARAAMRQLVGQISVGRHGMTEGEPGHAAWVEVNHFTVKRVMDSVAPGDPHVHTHFVVPNFVIGESGQVRSLHTARINEARAVAERTYQHRLNANLLNEKFNVAIDKKTQTVRVLDIPDVVLDEFKKRTRQGEDMAAKIVPDWDALNDTQRLFARDAVMLSPQGRQVGTDGAFDDMANIPAWRTECEKVGWIPPMTFLPVVTERERVDARVLLDLKQEIAAVERDVLWKPEPIAPLAHEVVERYRIMKHIRPALDYVKRMLHWREAERPTETKRASLRM